MMSEELAWVHEMSETSILSHTNVNYRFEWTQNIAPDEKTGLHLEPTDSLLNADFQPSYFPEETLTITTNN